MKPEVLQHDCKIPAFTDAHNCSLLLHLFRLATSLTPSLAQRCLFTLAPESPWRQSLGGASAP